MGSGRSTRRGRGRGKTQTDARAIGQAQKREMALELRLQGKSFRQIAAALGYRSISGAEKLIRKAIADITAAPAEELRLIEDQRLEMLWADLWERYAQTGPRKPVPAAMLAGRLADVLRMRAKLHGLETPVKQMIELEAHLKASPEEIEESAMQVLAEACRKDPAKLKRFLDLVGVKNG